MKKARALLLAVVVSSGAAYAAPPQYQKAYDAIYELKSPTGQTTLHQMSDGKGHLRSETTARGSKTATIYDYPGKTVITLMEAQHMYIKTALKDPDHAAIAGAGDTKPPGATSLGTKVIDSHPCHGYETKSPTVTSRVWIGDDIKNLVLSETTTKQGTTSMVLKSFANGAPAQDLLAIPAGCSEMKVPSR